MGGEERKGRVGERSLCTTEQRWYTYMYNLGQSSLPPHPLVCILIRPTGSNSFRVYRIYGAKGPKITNTCSLISCGDKLHGAPGWETGLFFPILAVPLSTATFIPLGHSVFIMYCFY